MVKICGSIPYKNKDDKKAKKRMLIKEFIGSEILFWTENKVLFYESKVKTNTAYF